MTSFKSSGELRGFMERLETVSKIVGAVSIPIIGLILTYVLQQQAASNQRTQLYATIMTGREKEDSDVRAAMFGRLLDLYLKPPAERRGTLEEFHDRAMLLDLLRSNFEEYFNARPLFSRLYDDLRAQQATAGDKDKQAWQALRRQLVGIAKDTTSRQVMRLVRAGHLTTDISVPMAVNATAPQISKRIALYPTRGLRGLTDDTFVAPLDDAGAAYRGTPRSHNIPWIPFLEGDREETTAARYSITIHVNEVSESGAQVSVLLYRDVFENGEFKQSTPDLRPIKFEVSYFSTPYMDNTRLFDGSRFSVIFDGCRDFEAPDGECRFPLRQSARPEAQFQVVVFDEAFLSQRDRPYIDQIVDSLGTARKR